MAYAIVGRRLAVAALAAGACILASACCNARAESEDIRIAHVYSKTGPLESVDLRFNGELVANPDRAAAPPAPKLLAKSVAKAPIKTVPKAAAVRRARHVH